MGRRGTSDGRTDRSIDRSKRWTRSSGDSHEVADLRGLGLERERPLGPCGKLIGGGRRDLAEADRLLLGGEGEAMLQALDDLERLRAGKSSSALLCSPTSPRNALTSPQQGVEMGV